MKKYFVIGNPIEHSLSPKLHNYWIKINDIDAIYEKKKLKIDQLKKIILSVKNKDIHGINVTVPFKRKVIRYLDNLTPEARITQSVNTIYLEGNQIKGHNTDIVGFTLSLEETDVDMVNKKVLILGAGGVVPSIIYSLNQMKVSSISVSNRTKNKAEDLKKLFNNITVISWGEVPDFDVIINATSLGLKDTDDIGMDFSKVKNKLFYDVIYNPQETNFLKKAKYFGNKTVNGKMMFVYQASASFNLWHKTQPEINKEVIALLDK